MKTIGEILKQARINKNQTISEISEQVKIRPDYLEAIELNQFDKLPSATFVKGFITGFAKSVDVNPEQALAVFRRDFDQNQKGQIVPRGLVSPINTPSRIWHPRTTTAVISTVLVLLVGAYFLKQLIFLRQAPEITLYSPDENQTTSANIDVVGITDPDATVTINQKPIATNLEGEFKTSLNLSSGPQVIIVVSTDREGRARTLERNIIVKPE